MSKPAESLQLTVSPRIKFKGTGSGKIESLNYDGRGVTRVEGKTTFVEGALPGEAVEFGITRRKPTFDNAVATTILQPSPDRVLKPRCDYFGTCGGCAIQHIRDEAQIHYKQQIVKEQLQHIGGVEPEQWAPPLIGPHWHYRRKARLGARLVQKKGGVLVGFREKASTYIADMDGCEILDERVASLIPEIKQLIAATSVAAQVPQIEVAGADNTVALVFRHLQPLSAEDRDRLIAFGRAHDMQIWVQPAGPDTVTCISHDQPEALYYGYDNSKLTIEFQPTDFTQVNAEVNRKMVTQAIDWLDVDGNSRVLDLFCGLGNFSLPLAEKVSHVTGVEGNQRLVDGAAANARRNGLTNAEFVVADLYDKLEQLPWEGKSFNRILVDPPRTGAIEVLKKIPDDMAQRIVYVSCYPGTLARDAAYLVQERGFRLKQVGVMDMFPQTTHVETMALFERDGTERD